ncbi:MAG: hypothetical protein IKB50_01640 [Clostridia bacterium]|nr:hypothetical protein [Clostridia bacterium]
MSIAEKLTAIAENEKKVFDAGCSEGESNMWDKITNYGNRKFYEYGFKYWGCEEFNPTYQIVPTSRSICMFEDSPKLKKVESRYLDLSNVTANNGAENTSNNYCTFRRCSALEEIEDVGMPPGGYYQTFGWCYNLHTVAAMRCKKEGGYTSPFNSCTRLRNLTIEGVIGNNFTVAHSSLLTKDSIISIITALFDFTGTADEYTRTLTLHSKTVSTLESLGSTSPNGNTWIEYIDDKKWNLTVA